MNIKIIITIIIFFGLLIINYKGAVGRIERKNQTTNEFQNLGPISEKEEIAFMEGRHKRLAFFQSFLGSIIWSIVIYGIMSIFI